ncbi:Chitobiase/beta-hexosaminidase C-terminal domain-containing protein [Granulicella rosea]|uniref:Chitobiase/beta-hexosaminidase C-terminal domain-containing protein n=1 Tax=Granulicella rosea TaxID=474952 RepID=A0A239EA88_9BACT|nr:chitobiase/beta-hexosaminidase C-terminal domain-containing protein [Granulicella rosea]SNS41670.1 Chitobiase/beta-hexosaminidase C-terminal domain-containing protein [Granulicella rosea]
MRLMFGIRSVIAAEVCALALGACFLVGCGSNAIDLTPAPAISPAGGTFTTPPTVALSDALEGFGVTIYFTLDGSTPTTSSLIFGGATTGAGLRVQGPFQILQSGTVNAIAVTANEGASPVTSASYVLNLPPTPTPTITPIAGTYVSPATVSIADSATGTVSIYYTLDGSIPNQFSAKYAAPISVSANTTVKAIAYVSGSSLSAVASASYVIQPAVPVISPAAGTYGTTQNVTITDATPGAAIYYTTDGSSPTLSSPVYSGPISVAQSETLQAIAVVPGDANSPVASAVYFIYPPAATPTISLAAGTFNSIQTVSIADTTPGASIYYTLDGSTPTTSSALYTSPISVVQTETLAASAIAPHFSFSPVASALYTLNLPVAPAVSFSPPGNIFTTAQTVVLTDSLAGSVIHYTTDGTTATLGSPQYTAGSAGISVSSTTKISAVATELGYNASPAVTDSYLISAPTTGFKGTVSSGIPPFSNGGPQLISGATVTLWTVGATGYGSAAQRIASTTTDSAGNFSFPSTYTCTGTYAYLTAAGGNPGASGGTANSAIKLMALIAGPTAANPIVENDLCASVKTETLSVNINEISSVAAIYGLAQFFNPTTESIGSSSTNPTGLLNAFNTVAYMMNIPSGLVNATYTPYGYNYAAATTNYNVTATPEQQKIYLIAGILASCVESTGPKSANCATLFTSAAPPPTPGATTLGSAFVYPTATDTLQAAYYMAVNPINATNAGVPNTNNMANLFGLAPAGSGTTVQPTDWTVALTLGSTAPCNDAACAVFAISAPNFLTLNGEGDVYFLSNSTTTQAVTGLMPYGGEGVSRYSTIGPLAGLTFDSGNGTSQAGYSVFYKFYTGKDTGTGNKGRENYEVNGGGTFALGGGIGAYFVDTNAQTVPLNGTQYAADATSIYFPVSGNGYVYGVPNAFQTSGSATAKSPYIASPSAVTVLTALNNGSAITGFTAATDVKVDQVSKVWVTAPGGNSVYSMPAANSQAITAGATPTAYTTGLYAPTGIAIDHANNAWVINSAGGTPSTGYIAEITAGGKINADTIAGDGGINAPTAVAIDGASNVWVASQTVSELASISGVITALSPSVGFAHSYNSPGISSIAIDLSGNVWVANSGGYASASVPGTLTVILGAAVPTVQPLGYAIQKGTLAALP